MWNSIHDAVEEPTPRLRNLAGAHLFSLPQLSRRSAGPSHCRLNCLPKVTIFVFAHGILVKSEEFMT